MFDGTDDNDGELMKLFLQRMKTKAPRMYCFESTKVGLIGQGFAHILATNLYSSSFPNYIYVLLH